jgi:hypothetical protein
MKILHYKMLTKDERNRLNGSDGGWDSEPRFTRYADVTNMAKESAIREALELGEYEEVAEVDTHDKETAFRLTNHIESDWQLNDGVTAKTNKARSTSVGDLMIDDDGDRWIVAPVGFKRLDPINADVWRDETMPGDYDRDVY